MKPAESLWLYRSWLSPKVAISSMYRLFGDFTPALMQLPLYSFSFTVPLTACCVLSTNAESASRRGVYHMPSYTSSANLLATSSL